jgi:hypothetical protein
VLRRLLFRHLRLVALSRGVRGSDTFFIRAAGKRDVVFLFGIVECLYTVL